MIEPEPTRKDDIGNNEEVFSSDVPSSSSQDSDFPDSSPVPNSPGATPTPSQMDDHIDTSEQLETHEIKRSIALEQRFPFILNLFYCFMFPYICRCSPILDEDMPQVMTVNSGDTVMAKVEPLWTKAHEQYRKDKIEYDQKKADLERNNPEEAFLIYPYLSFYLISLRKKLPPLKAPNIVMVTMKGTFSLQIFLAICVYIISYVPYRLLIYSFILFLK